MSILIDKTGKMVEVEMYGTNGSEWSDDFYSVGNLEYDEKNGAYIVDDTVYCADQAEDWKNCTGDWDMQESHDRVVRVYWLVWDAD